MVIQVRDRKNGKLRVKDILDIDFDMYVEEFSPKKLSKRERLMGITTHYRVVLNGRYEFAKEYETEDDAEEAMVWLAEARNDLEDELRSGW